MCSKDQDEERKASQREYHKKWMAQRMADPEYAAQHRRRVMENYRRRMEKLRSDPEKYAEYRRRQSEKSRMKRAEAKKDPAKYAEFLSKERQHAAAKRNAIRENPERLAAYKRRCSAWQERQKARMLSDSEYANAVRAKRKAALERIRNDPELLERQRKSRRDSYHRMLERLSKTPGLLEQYRARQVQKSREYVLRIMASGYTALADFLSRRMKAVAKFRGKTLMDASPDSGMSDSEATAAALAAYERKLYERGKLGSSQFNLEEFTRKRQEAEIQEMRKADLEVQEQRRRFMAVEDAMRLPPEERYKVSAGWTAEEREYALALERGDARIDGDLLDILSDL